MKTRAAETETGKQSYSLAELSTLRKQLQQQLDAAGALREQQVVICAR